MNVPLLDLKAQFRTIQQEIESAVLDVVRSGQYIMGPKVEALEKEVAAYSDVPHGIGVTSGTDALLVALMALDVHAGDVVITTPYSFFATAGVVSRLGAEPVFVDIDPKTYNLDPALLKKWFEKNSNKVKKVKAIIPVHLYGQCANMGPILEIAQAHSIPVIEDAAQAIGSTYPSQSGKKKAGSMGLMGCFSFFPSKNLGGIGDGGMVVTKDAALADKLKKLRNHGAAPKYFHAMIGGNFRLDPVQAAVLSVKLKHLESWHAGRQKNAAYYTAHLNVPGIQKPEIAYSPEDHIYNQYVISVPDRRDALRKFLTDNQIGNEVYYPVPFHLQECFRYLGYKKGDFVHSEYAAEHTIALPIYPELTREMQDFVIQKITEFYK
jgi:dTDP-4-amino-4,6-dideoxygalactose transaminase